MEDEDEDIGRGARARGVEEGVELLEKEGGLVCIGLGARGNMTSPALFIAGYPSHCRPDRTHLMHSGLVSSHLTLRPLFIRSVS